MNDFNEKLLVDELHDLQRGCSSVFVETNPGVDFALDYAIRPIRGISNRHWYRRRISRTISRGLNSGITERAESHTSNS